MNYQSYKLINDSEISYIAKGVNAALAKWNSEWCINDAVTLALNVHTMVDSYELLASSESNWLIGDIEEHSSVGIHWTETSLSTLYESLFNAKVIKSEEKDVASFVSQKIVNESIQSLLKTIVKEFSNQIPIISFSENDEVTFLENINKDGSGYLLLSICINNEDFLTIVINSEVIIGKDADNGKCEEILASAIDSFGDSTVKLQALLGVAELDIKSITDLSVGDVITLDKKLNDELSFYIDGHEVCTGYVGVKEGSLAVKIGNSRLN